MKKALTALVCAMLATGCYKTTFVNDTVPLGAHEESEMVWFFLWGLAGDPEVDTRKACNGGEAREVTYEQGPVGVLLSIVTIGIVSPRNVEIQCAGPAAAPRPQ